MKKLKTLKDIQIPFALTIGNFDGVHLGHKALIRSIHKKTDSSLPLALLTFIPHPSEILRPIDQGEDNGFLINTYDQRRDLLEKEGVDYLYEVTFNRDFSTLSPKSFLKNYILTTNYLKKIFLGYDFAFGAHKKGNHDFVKEYLKNTNVDLEIMSGTPFKEEMISSSRIRKNISKGKTEEACELLGREFFMRGEIIKGAGRGKQIGYPTANLSYNASLITPSVGVYSTTTHYKGSIYKSVTNVGYNPTFKDEKVKSIETYILNFDKDIYGEEIEVKFLKKIRNEFKFSSVSELISQIARDVEKRKNQVVGYA